MKTVIDEATWDYYRKHVPRGEDPGPDTGVFLHDLRTNIILQYLYLARRVVGKMKKSMPAHVERDDLESWAKIGLMQAVQRYDHTLGVPFEAFATQRMRSVIMDGIRDADWAPRSLRKKQRDITKIEDQFREDMGRDPTVDEVALIVARNKAQGELAPRDVPEAVEAAKAEIAGTKYHSDIASHTYIEGSLEAQNKPASINDEEDELVELLKSVVAHCLSTMSIRKAAIVALHYYEELNLSDIAALLKMSDVRVGNLHSEAILEIWHSLENALKDV